MKATIILNMLCLFWISSFPQVPQSFKYQAVARNSTGEILANNPVSFRISILSGSTSGTVIYSEIHQKTTNTFGLVDLEIGKGSSTTGNFCTINWGQNFYFFKVEMDPAGGTAYQVMGTSHLLSVPYALHSKTAESITGTVFSHYVGESYGGGVVFYVAPNKDSINNEHGLIISTAYIGWADLSSFWGINQELSLWNGAENTNFIVTNENPSNPTPAHVCVDYRGGGYADWYLPSNRELQLLYRVYVDIEVTQGPNPEFQAFGNICSSSLKNLAGLGWPYYLDHNDGGVKPYLALEGLIEVRAIRKF